jgi:hypothetical protein
MTEGSPRVLCSSLPPRDALRRSPRSPRPRANPSLVTRMAPCAAAPQAARPCAHRLRRRRVASSYACCATRRRRRRSCTPRAVPRALTRGRPLARAIPRFLSSVATGTVNISVITTRTGVDTGSVHRVRLRLNASRAGGEGSHYSCANAAHKRYVTVDCIRCDSTCYIQPLRFLHTRAYTLHDLPRRDSDRTALRGVSAGTGTRPRVVGLYALADLIRVISCLEDGLYTIDGTQ